MPLPMHSAQFWMFEAFRLAGAARLLLCDGDSMSPSGMPVA